jgi:glutamate synthase domain-containing protein 2
MNKYLKEQYNMRFVFMTELSRMQLIQKADEICEFARKIFNNKRSELLRKAAQFYKEATLSIMAEKVEKEADDWEVWYEKGGE